MHVPEKGAVVAATNRCSADPKNPGKKSPNRGLIEKDGELLISFTPKGGGDPCEIKIPFEEKKDTASSVAQAAARKIEESCAKGHVTVSETKNDKAPYWFFLTFWDIDSYDIGSNWSQLVTYTLTDLKKAKRKGTPTEFKTSGEMKSNAAQLPKEQQDVRYLVGAGEQAEKALIVTLGAVEGLLTSSGVYLGVVVGEYVVPLAPSGDALILGLRNVLLGGGWGVSSPSNDRLQLLESPRGGALLACLFGWQLPPKNRALVHFVISPGDPEATPLGREIISRLSTTDWSTIASLVRRMASTVGIPDESTLGEIRPPSAAPGGGTQMPSVLSRSFAGHGDTTGQLAPVGARPGLAPVEAGTPAVPRPEGAPQPPHGLADRTAVEAQGRSPDAD